MNQERATNRRQSLRRSARRSVHFECRKGLYGLGPNFSLTVLDISDTGVRVVVNQHLAVADEVEISISGYGLQKAIKRLGNVRWQVKLENGTFCVGVEFQKRLLFRDWQNLIAAQ